MSGFDVLSPHLPLFENHFLEASAGTGKTFAIEHIFLRLLLEDDGPSVDQILVVTFTKAATYELKQRIRKTIENALVNPESYPFLQGKNLYLIKKKLLRAASLFDEAKIMTIHKFCFHSLYSDQMEPNEKNCESHIQRIKDYLRTELCHFPSFQIDKVMRKYQFDIDRLIKDLSKVALKRAKVVCGRPFFELEKAIFSELESLKREFAPSRDKIYTDLLQIVPCYKNFCNRKKEIKKEVLEEIALFSSLFEAPLDLFSFSHIPQIKEENRLQKEYPENIHYPALYKQWEASLFPLLEEGNDGFLIFATIAEGVRRHLEKEENIILHDDFLLLMEQKLDNLEFCKQIRNSYKAVLIDEFQDTDRIQWKIFSKLFLNSVPLYLIGDPKQSIYRFRGADIYTYMEAKKAFSTHETLSRNYRAQKSLVEGLNRLFSSLDPFLVLPKTKESLICPKIECDPKKVEWPFHDDKGSVHFLLGDNESLLFPAIVDEIIILKNMGNIPLKEFVVLVKDRYQAMRFKEYARSRNLMAVTTKSRSLVESRAFNALRELLEELGRLKKKGAVEKILASSFFSFPFDEIETMKERMISSLFSLKERLETQGILSFFHMLMDELNGYASILPTYDGLEFYADLLQLVEILLENCQTPSDYLPYFQKLIENNVENEELLSYSIGTEDGVKIMTIHGSKGLEFDVVFALGLTFSSKLRKELIYEPEDHIFTFSKDKMQRESDEIKSEKLRLFYVAATRARKRLYLPYIEKEKNSPLSIFLNGKSCDDFLPEITHTYCDKKNGRAFNNEQNRAILQSPPPPSLFFKPINITSFSQLAHINYDTSSPLATTGLPPGKETGNLLHSIFEKIAFHQPLQPIISQCLEHSSYKIWEKEIIELVENALGTPFPVNPSFTLRDIDPKKIIKEREFLYFSPEKGDYLKGFIDCIFEHNNRVYIVDWKSNYLEDYSLTSLENEMKKHDYFLQEAIYREALYRSFPGVNFGGTFYFFIRGKAIYGCF